jgi:AcrR family transcriptional regulator
MALLRRSSPPDGSGRSAPQARMSAAYNKPRSSLSRAESSPRLVGARLNRYPASGGYACGKQTRARIISAALRVFGERGYDRASTRQIAERAGVNTPAIQYYFGSKLGLHSACTRHVIEGVSSALALPLARARDARHTATPAVALGALCELLAAVVDVCVTTDGRKPAQAVFREDIGAGLFNTVVRLVAAATRHSSGAKLTRLRACVLLGQVRSLYENRAHTLAVMGRSHFDEHAVALIKSVVRQHTRGALSTTRASSTQAERRHRGHGLAGG